MEKNARRNLLEYGQRLEYVTLGWNVVGVGVLAMAAYGARSVALAGFGLDSLVEIGASTVVLWELRGDDAVRTRRALGLIASAFVVLAIYLVLQGVVVLVDRYHAGHSDVGLAWTGLTVLVMGYLARAKSRTGRALGNDVLVGEGRVTLVDAILAAAVFVGVALNAAFGWWWADPAAGFVLAVYAVRECRAIAGARGAH